MTVLSGMPWSALGLGAVGIAVVASGCGPGEAQTQFEVTSGCDDLVWAGVGPPGSMAITGDSLAQIVPGGTQTFRVALGDSMSARIVSLAHVGTAVLGGEYRLADLDQVDEHSYVVTLEGDLCPTEPEERV